jgi:nucleotide-binding universal stress UspA family protein
MKKILVPTDFSPNASKALDFAVQIAKHTKAKILLVHACDLLELTFKDNLALKKEFNRKIIMEARGKLSLFKKSIEDTEKVTVQTKLYKGFIADTILHATKENKADIIIMGTLGSAGAKEKILGSKTAGVIGKTSVPVLAVPLLSEWDVPKNILLAINNFKEGTPDLVGIVFELAQLFNAEVHIVKFTDADTAHAIDYLSDERGGNAYVKKMQLMFKKVNIKFIHLDGHKFEKTIEKYITGNSIDIVAMITHKRTLLKSIFNRSLTKKMSYHTSIPLLAIPA